MPSITLTQSPQGPIVQAFVFPSKPRQEALRMEMQKSIGEVKSSIEALRHVADGTKAKVDDLVNWKHRIIGGAAMLGAILTAVGFLVAKFSDRIHFS